MTFELTPSPTLPLTTRRTVQRALSLLEKHLREPGALFTSTAAPRLAASENDRPGARGIYGAVPG
jgi:hypothetical protein